MKKTVLIILLYLFMNTVLSANSISEILESGILKKGSRGANVFNLQDFLNTFFFKQGDVTFTPLEEDSKFGSKTQAAVKAFQMQQGLKSDGIVGKETLKKILDELANPEASSQTKSNEENTSKDEPTTSGGDGQGNIVKNMKATTFCIERDGGRDKEMTCGNDIGREGDNYFIKSACTAITKRGNYYFHDRDKNRPNRKINKEICILALSQNNLRSFFGSASHKSYCGKKIMVCYKPNNRCVPMSVESTGPLPDKTLDMTGPCFDLLGVPRGVRTIEQSSGNIYIYRIN